MRTYEEYQRILTLWEQGHTKKGIARITDIPRRTIIDCIQRYENLAGLEAQQERASKSTPDLVLTAIKENPTVKQAYAYLLGLYLGDGYINLQKNGRSYRIRIALDDRYPGIIDSCTKAIATILPDNIVGHVQGKGCTYVACYYKHWPTLFPQHAHGSRKHQRTIALEEWQLQIVDAYPLEVFRGLYHSDGSRFSNIVNGKDYPRYQFSNKSNDIIQLFCYVCTRLGLEWSYRKETHTAAGVFVSRRKDVEYLDSVIGPKR
ncbi:MAG: helix-turn-helix domain-containing protein [bacterium]|nr:helix-turn-helix domain-containing protein [bacterium]